MNLAARRSCWNVSRQQMLLLAIRPTDFCRSVSNNISASCFYQSKCAYKSAGTPVLAKRRSLDLCDRFTVHQVINMNFYQRPAYPMMAAILNISRRKKCNNSVFNAKYSYHRNCLFGREYLLWDANNKKSGTVNKKQQNMNTFYSSGSNINQIQEVSRIAELPIVVEDSSKPTPPDPETCCETGCVNCVWIKYVEELQKYYPDGVHGEDVEDILKQIHDPLVRSFVKMELGV